MKNLNNETLNGMYKYIKPLGSGAIGVVALFENNQSSERVAIKQLPAYLIEPQFLVDAKKEQAIMRRLQYPGIPRLYDAFQIGEQYYLVMEYCNRGHLCTKLFDAYFAKITQNKVFLWHFVFEITRQVLTTLQFVHKQGIIHRDIKPTNILVHQNGWDVTVKLTDFGSATQLKNNHNSIVGTLEFLPPEILNKQQYNQAVDIWAFGCSLFYILFDKIPFLTFEDARKTTYSVDLKQLEVPTREFHKMLQIIKDCTAIDPSARPSAAQLLQKYFVLHHKPIQKLLLKKNVSVAIFGGCFLEQKINYQNYVFEFVYCTRFQPFYDVYAVCATDTVVVTYLVDYLEAYGKQPFLIFNADAPINELELLETLDLFNQDDRMIIYSAAVFQFIQEMCHRLIIVGGQLENSRIFRSKSAAK